MQIRLGPREQELRNSGELERMFTTVSFWLVLIKIFPDMVLGFLLMDQHGFLRFLRGGECIFIGGKSY